ncbi:MAG: Gldg family protein [Deltaproteobacteria bacterium]|nr:Gldg family protein [Deltaproteobacteria bacterium]
MGVKEKTGAYFKFIIYLVVVILINIAGTTLFFRSDLTDNNVYSLSEISKNVVSTLSEPLTINAFFTKDLPAPHNNTEKYLQDLLEEYSVYNKKYFNYRFYDVTTDEGDIDGKSRENRDLAATYGIYPIQIQAVEKDEIKFMRAYMGLSLVHGDIIEKIPTITSTDRLEYQLTTAIQKMNNKISALLRLEGKVNAKLFLSSSLEKVAPHMDLKEIKELPGVIERTVEELGRKNYGKLDFEHLDPSLNPELENVLENYDVVTLKWPEIPEKDLSAGRGSIGLVMEYGDRAVTTPLLRILNLPIIGTRYQLMEAESLAEVINENFEYLIDINEDLGVLAGHGTLNIGGAAASKESTPSRQEIHNNFQKLVSQTYSLKNFNLKDGKIPYGLNCVVIAGPTETFSEYELFQIDQYLMSGKNLAIFLSPFNEISPPGQMAMTQPPIYLPVDTGLEKLLEHYGISIKKSYVMDENCFKQPGPQSMGGGEMSIYFAPFIKDEFINNELPFMKNLKALVVAKISPLVLNQDRIKESGLRAHKLFSSSEKSWEMSGRINLNPMAIYPPQSDDEKESKDLAYLIEGEFPSYFAGKPIPVKETKAPDTEKTDAGEVEEEVVEASPLPEIEGEREVINRGKPAKIFIIGSSELLTDNLLDAEEINTNATFLLNVLDYLNGREGIALMRSKEHTLNPLVETNAGIKAVIKSFNIVGLPIIVVIFGLFIFFYRKTRRKNIKMMFQN